MQKKKKRDKRPPPPDFLAKVIFYLVKAKSVTFFFNLFIKYVKKN